MNRSSSLLACIFATLLPFATVNVAHGAQASKSSKTTIKQAKSAKIKKLAANKKTPRKSAKAETVVQATAIAAAAPVATMAAPASANPYLSNAPSQPTENPYLAYQMQVAAPAAVAAPSALSQQPVFQPKTNPYLASVPHPSEPANPWQSLNQAANNNPLPSFLPNLSSTGEGLSLLPKIKTVYPTGEKPLKVLTFKCPTELVGITTPPIKLLRGGVDLVMEGLNRSDLLPFDLQQVCM